MKNLSRAGLLWFCAGVGWDLQGRVMDHVFDAWFEHVTWLSWMVQ